MPVKAPLKVFIKMLSQPLLKGSFGLDSQLLQDRIRVSSLEKKQSHSHTDALRNCPYMSHLYLADPPLPIRQRSWSQWLDDATVTLAQQIRHRNVTYSITVHRDDEVDHAQQFRLRDRRSRRITSSRPLSRIAQRQFQKAISSRDFTDLGWEPWFASEMESRKYPTLP